MPLKPKLSLFEKSPFSEQGLSEDAQLTWIKSNIEEGSQPPPPPHTQERRESGPLCVEMGPCAEECPTLRYVLCTERGPCSEEKPTMNVFQDFGLGPLF